MKKITTPKRVTSANALGRMVIYIEQFFEVEESDVGVTRPNYLGHGYSNHRFTESDVGRHIHHQYDGTGWSCWSFTAFKREPETDANEALPVFELRHKFLGGLERQFTIENNFPDWLLRKENFWFFEEHVASLSVGQSIETDHHTITRIS